MKRPALFLLAAAASSLAAADRVVCRYTYGGESREFVAAPAASPYAVAALQVGSYFKFRVVFQDRPADVASIKVYVYADRDEGDMPLHHATWPYPPPAPGRHGFTGLQRVYEPVRDGELEYWCRLRGGRKS